MNRSEFLGRANPAFIEALRKHFGRPTKEDEVAAGIVIHDDTFGIRFGSNGSCETQSEFDAFEAGWNGGMEWAKGVCQKDDE